MCANGTGTVLQLDTKKINLFRTHKYFLACPPYIKCNQKEWSNDIVEIDHNIYSNKNSVFYPVGEFTSYKTFYFEFYVFEAMKSNVDLFILKIEEIF
jgi:hypothetical protein